MFVMIGKKRAGLKKYDQFTLSILIQSNIIFLAMQFSRKFVSTKTN